MTTNLPPDDGHRWAAFGASVRGAAHVREDLPNQDAEACRGDDSGRWAAVAVADGHGHSLAVRADRGAELAVEVALAAAQSCWDSLGGHPDRFVAATVSKQLPDVIADNWMASVERDLRERPFSEAELERSGNLETLTAQPEAAYGTTLLVALAVGGSIVACQVGDGDLVAVTADGGVVRPLPPDNRLVGTKTTSLASRTAHTDFRSGNVVVGQDRIEVIVLATDGYVNSFSAEDGFAAAGRDLWKLIRQVGPSQVEGALANWLESTSSDGTGDDATLAILFDEAGFANERASAVTMTISDATVSDGEESGS